MANISKTLKTFSIQNRSWKVFAIAAAAFPVVSFALTLGVLTLLKPSEVKGTLLEPPKDTVPFTLTNQFGETVSWDKYRGKVTVMTFLYTSCPDLCPLTAAKLRETYGMLGSKASKVAFVAITVDPERDIPEKALEFSNRWDMADKWDFLTGEQGSLEPLWKEYWVGRIREEALGTAGSGTSSRHDPIIGHAAPVHLLDRQGRDRIVYGNAFSASDIAHDIMVLLR